MIMKSLKPLCSIALGVVLFSFHSNILAEEVYRDNHVRFTLIDEGTIRLEYAPDGKFVDEKSFVAVIREYGSVPHKASTGGNKVTITTSKFKLTYRKDGAPLSAKNLTIASAKTLGTSFSWTPGMEQKGNLKGTYRTLDGYDGDMFQYSNPKTVMPLEDGLLATDGWTLIDDSKNYLFDGAKDWDWVKERTSADGAQDWYFMAYGHDYKGALKSFTKFAGKVPLPPRYTFGYWWSRYWSYSDKDLRDLIGNFQRLDLPLDVLVIDMDWHPISEQAGGGWTGWDWNERLFPDYKKFLSYLDEQGVKTTMNLHPADGVRPYEKKYQEFIGRAGIENGKTVEWQGSDKRYVKALFDTYLHPYVDEGVDFWWLDWQQWAKDKRLKDLDNVFWCNYIWFTDMENNGTKRPMLYHRWGGLGNHRYQIGFSGDSYITWESLRFLPYFNSTASNVLYGYWSHDIGGHQSKRYGTPVEPELYTRAMQMGQYLPIIRSHSTKDPQLNKEPWAFDQTTQRRLSNVINGRYALVPYIYTMARQDYETGISLCRPMYYDYPEAEEAYGMKEQYMFGDKMLIAPVTNPVDKESGLAAVKAWLPEGQWLEYETGTMLEGGQTVERLFSMDEYPVYVKAGSIIPYYGKVKNLSGTNQPVIVRIFPGGSEGDFLLYEDNGEDKNYVSEYATTPLSYQRNGNTLSVTIGERKGSYKDMPARRDYTVALPCQKAPASVKVDGKEVAFTYDGLNLETCIALGSIDCSKGAAIEVSFPSADYAVMAGEKGQFHRIQNAVQDFKQHDAGMVYTEDFGFLEATPLRLSYHPETQNETLAHFHKLYKKLPLVLIEQMGKNQNFDRFMRQVGEDGKMVVEVSPEAFSTAAGTGFDLRYFPNKALEGEAKATGHLEKMDFFIGGSPTQGIPENYWSMTAESTFTAPETGNVMFVMTGDDAYRLIVDGKELFSDWGDHAETTRNAAIPVEAGKKYNIRIEYYDNEYNAILRMQTLFFK
jgi:alpha-glucosidase (family GH31 glycosyl hydrolase)